MTQFLAFDPKLNNWCVYKNVDNMSSIMVYGPDSKANCHKYLLEPGKFIAYN